MALGGAGLVALLVGGFVLGSVLRLGGEGELAAASQSDASPSASASASAQPSPSEAPTATPLASPTPVPTPAGPPQDVAVGAWATVTVDELNVRSAAGTGASSNAILVRGAIVHVAEGPVAANDINWYRIASLGGTVGWATSGWVAEPFMTTLVDDPTLIRCGDVGRAVFDVVDGVPSAHDPIAIGDYALPAAKFSDDALAAIELLRGVGQEACFTAQVGPDGLPAISVQLNVTACGHAVAEGDFFRLRPAAGGGHSPESKVKDPVVVHPGVLAGGPESRMASNIRTGLAMMASTSDAAGCMHLSVTRGNGESASYRAVDTMQCSVVSEYNANNLRLSPAAGGNSLWFKLSSSSGQYQPGAVPLDVATLIGVNVSTSDDGHAAWVYNAGQSADCG